MTSVVFTPNQDSDVPLWPSLIPVQAIAPASSVGVWVDTSLNPPLLKSWDDVAGEWRGAAQLLANPNEVDALKAVASNDPRLANNVRTDDARLADARPQKGWPQPANGTNLDTLTTVGLYPIAGFASVASMTPALPVLASGMLEVLTLGLARVQRWTTSGTPQQVWQRSYDGGVWLPWRRIDRDTQSAIVSLSRSQGTTYTAPSVTAYSFRQLLRLTCGHERFRVHFRNYEERTGTAYSATLNVNGVWIGEAAVDAVTGELTGQFKAAPVQIASAFTMPTDGSVYMTPWIDWQTFQIKPGVDYIVSFGYTGPGGQDIARYRGFGWGNATPGDASATPSFNSLSSTTIVPLSTRIELTTTAPRVAMIGDSHTAANNARYPVLESPINLWAMANGAAPINVGHGGSNLNEWRSVNQQRWLTYSTAKAEAAIIWLGQNDVFNNARTLAQMQGDFIVVANSARTTFGPNLYAMTLMPRNGGVPAGTDAIRLAFNAWLRTLPCRIAGVIDAADAVTDPATGLVRADLIDPDLTHLNTAGCARVAGAIPYLLGRK